MDKINVSEVSDILKLQLEDLNIKSKFEETGTVLQVHDGVVRIYGLDNVGSQELIIFENGEKAVAMNLEQDNVGAILLGETSAVKEGDTVKRTGKIISINVGEGLLGRVISILGEPIDGVGPITGDLYEMPVERKAPGVVFRETVDEPLQTGIKSIDA